MDGRARILVTGGAGFIGSELVRQLVERGPVCVVDNLVSGRRDNLAGLPAGSAEIVVADIRDGARMSALLRGVDIVFHLACLGVRHSIHSPRENHAVNATGTLELLGNARRAGVARFVNVSSSEVYGTARRVPMAEDHPTQPSTVYGASKLAGECYARAFHHTYGYPTVVVRPFNTYGPRGHHEGDSGEVIPRFLLRCLAGHPMVVFGDGDQTRDFSEVSDIARGILLAGFAPDTVGKTLNLGSGREITVNDLARLVAAVAGQPGAGVLHAAGRPGDVRRLCADTEKARALLGFAPDVDLRTGLARLRDWYLGGPEPPERLLEQERLRAWEDPELRADAR
jgi:UDP-glucose 4-epimerase